MGKRCQGCWDGSTVCNYVGTAVPGKERSNKIAHIGPFSKSDQSAVRITESASPIPTIWILGIGVRDRLTSLPEGCRSATLIACYVPNNALAFQFSHSTRRLEEPCLGCGKAVEVVAIRHLQHKDGELDER